MLTVGSLFVEALFERAPLARGDSVLDVACGTGIVARLGKQRVGGTGRVVGMDLSPLMLDVARTIAPEIDWREGDAAGLPVDAAEKFDAVFCQQGLQFVPDKPAAVLEMRRVLAPGGTVAIATWRPADQNSCFRALQNVAERHLGPVVDDRRGFPRNPRRKNAHGAFPRCGSVRTHERHGARRNERRRRGDDR